MTALPFNMARLKERFKLGDLQAVYLTEDPFHKGKWQMEISSRLDGLVQVESAKGEIKRFSSVEAARNFACQIGFNKMQIGW